MRKDNPKGNTNKSVSLPPISNQQKSKSNTMKEEISLELAELGNLNPKHEPMTQNNRQKSESEKTYK
ncbi:hypothetical protein I2483_02415 [Sporosarcina sp. E16_3]|uniref:hypothetical protein n=1 Tax=unclassified Sporosarcina TaxID=2647733 RepID=UPI00164690B8|nr:MULTISPECIES: hypothetical protein [unclassified Sporosarcina]MBO0600506.1 hypothetical protein [Sporosarcina sp. E16_3]